MAEEKSKDRIRRIIAALRAKTEENGCSEEEAMAAAEKLGQLLREHDMTLDEAGIGLEAKHASKRIVRAPDEYADSVVVGISRLCDLIVWRSNNNEYSLFGTEPDLEVALYLYEVISYAMDDDWSKFMEEHGYSVKKRASFRMGFAHRVNDRLRELKRERDAAKAAMAKTGTNLVVVKDQLVKSEFDKLGIKLRAGRAKSNAADGHAYGQGQAAGSRVNLNNAIGGPSSAGRLS